MMIKNRRKYRIAVFAVFLGVCLTSGAWAEAKPQEHDLFGVLENDLLPGSDSQEPAASDSPAIAEDKTTPAKDVQTAAAAAENDLLITQGPTSPIQRELWEARISTAEKTEGSHIKNELEQVIRQINAIEIKPEVQAEKATAVFKTKVESEPNEVAPEKTPPKAKVDSAEKGTENGLVSEQTLQRFKDLSQNPKALVDPLELADVLFKSHCLEEAAVCYREALGRISPQEDDFFEDKAWILLQLGNCSESGDQKAAQKYYQAVITELPSSMWAPLAKNKNDLISWYLKDHPEKVIDELESKTNQ